MDVPARSAPRDAYAHARTSSNLTHSDGEYATSPRASPNDIKDRSAKPRWFKQVKDWVSVTEPSAQAMKNQKRTAYKKHGIERNDPQAAEKMHLPIGKVPDGVTTSTRGPRPEKALKQRAKENAERQLYTGRSGSQSVSSGMSSNASTREARQIAPWV
ncbi:hypothetical protein PLIIFM63780_007081 [Purpureocillium lilacinum]|uniref:Uncharacterized protein n=2 Tax=Purpureocillium lilacinum TaxID=33203 RepID=A0A179GUJ3_PURLI|nr:hypothetical protein Purlil1_9020 [Purpureocillium lilacinum]OAQ81617.1 hypothetical protein VFPBJ_04201 [Purpureocillium lilacinum]PWI65161.1 hypothetical protein PCL_07338 [Purpureocillium lilacinum]GJN73018.1 hypothetical protein PLICBS_007094 [Purpureocillium lilacinum]GJN83532.1 hypothetical protein PLIIFM63780_007081 [Purpureocillium lilacinum]